MKLQFTQSYITYIPKEEEKEITKYTQIVKPIFLFLPLMMIEPTNQ
jgi:hypothetical protein